MNLRISDVYCLSLVDLPLPSMTRYPSSVAEVLEFEGSDYGRLGN